LTVAALGLLLPATSAQAAFPGDNGKIVFSSNRDSPNPTGCLSSGTCNFEIYTMNPDGTGVMRLTNDSAHGDFTPAWSADGMRIVWMKNSQIWTMNADGSNQMLLFDDSQFDPNDPSWSPDGNRIVFRGGTSPSSNPGVFLVNRDGTGVTGAINSDGEFPANPRWSADGQKIVFSGVDFGGAGYPKIYTVDPAGSSTTQLTFDPPGCCDLNADRAPDWAPDGGSILFWRNDRLARANADGSNVVDVALGPYTEPVWAPDMSAITSTRNDNGNYEIYRLNPDGTNPTNITNNAARDGSPDWQPIQPPGYARPKTATPTTIRLVPAYDQCTSGNASHGAPLAVASCSPAVQSSDYLTVGTPETNGFGANATGRITMKVQTEAPINLTNGDQSDVSFTGQITDVRNKQTLTDYTGELRASFGIRLTDRMNGTNSVRFHPATAADASFGFSFGCTSTPSATVGSTCSIATSADAAVPGITPEFKRAIWDIGQVEVYDGGADSDADTTGDNTLFMTQGLFAP
jgi:Tol biopolymer transport system component